MCDNRNCAGHIIEEAYYIEEKLDFSQKKPIRAMGLAMHVATDAFAHSSFRQIGTGSYPWTRITHTADSADDVTVYPKRVQMAYAVEKNVVNRYNGNRGNYHTCNDFYNTASGAYTGLTFRITKMKTFAEAAGYGTADVLGDFGKLQNPY